MSVSNIGGIVNLAQGLVGLNAAAGGAFASALARQNQGVAMFPDMVRDVLARADLASSLAAKMYFPTANGAASLAISTAATGQLIGVVADNSQAATAAYVVLFDATVGGTTLGTTNPKRVIQIPAATMVAVVFADAPAFLTAMTWDSTTNIYAGATRSTAAAVTLAAVYVA
jgi:hypothetical protein